MMQHGLRISSLLLLSLSLGMFAATSSAQTGNAGSIEGTVADSSGGAVVGATVEISNPVSGFTRTTTTDSDGAFRFSNIPFNPYHLKVTAQGFARYAQDVEVRSTVPTKPQIALTIQAAATTVTVESTAGDLVETESTFHTDVDRDLFEKLPLESLSSSVSSLVTVTTPGVSADSNGLFHGLGDHASNSFSVDGQPITDQQSKVFSNQIPSDSIQSMEVISGAPPAEFGDKTSLVIKVTTRSGLGIDKPHGNVSASYGSFGSPDLSFDLAAGGPRWGNFIAVNGMRTSRFLDPPDRSVFHDRGNQENVFDRVDYKFSQADTLNLNLGFTRSWFQTPNSFDAQAATAWSGLVVNNGGLGPDGLAVGSQDQRAQIKTFNLAPVWTHLFSTNALLTFGGFARHDGFHYYPSKNPFGDLSPNLQRQSVAQNRTLTNAGVRSDLSYVKGSHNVKIGALYQQTFLTEHDGLGIVDPTFNPVCLNADGTPDTDPFVTDPGQCGGPSNVGGSVNANFIPLLACYDLTRPTPAASSGCANTASQSYLFKGHTDVKELSLYVQDTISKGNWSFNLGIRGDVYNGMTSATQAEPRLGVAYNIKPTNTVLRVSYARTLETPFNENLIIASSGCNDAVIDALETLTEGYPCLAVPLRAGWRNEFHAGVQQALGKYLVINGEYIWKYTHYGFDFSDLGNTPIFFPVEWHNSKIPGYAIRASVPNFHGFTALVVLSSVAARFFQPQVSGIGVTPTGQGGTGVFRIDHDEKFNQTTHLQYQPSKKLPWIGFNWRYDGGQVAGALPFATSADPTAPGYQVDLTGLTADQQIAAGLFCGSVYPTYTAPLTTCPGNLYGSKLASIPKPGTQNPDKNPARIQPRNLFDVAIGDDNLFGGDRHRWSLRLTVVNLTNKTALYNFLSTFSGSHFVTSRTETVELGFHF